MFLSTWLALWMMMGGPVQRPSVRFQRHGSSVALRMKYVSDPAVKFLPPREFPALTHPCHLMRTQSQSAPGGWPSRQRTGVAAQLFSDALVTGGNGMNEAGRRKLGNSYIQHVSFHTLYLTSMHDGAVESDGSGGNDPDEATSDVSIAVLDVNDTRPSGRRCGRRVLRVF